MRAACISVKDVPPLFTYCTQVLHLSEHAAYGRIEAARAARKFPVVLDLLADGTVTLTTVTLLASHLTPANHVEVLNAARHRSKRDVEVMVAGLRPLPDVPATVKRLPTRPAVVASVGVAPASSDDLTGQPALCVVGGEEPLLQYAPRPRAVAAPEPSSVTPLTPERYKVQLTVSRETNDKLRRAQDLLRHSIPNGDLAIIVDRALTLLLEDLERSRLAATARPRSSGRPAKSSRHIPAAVRRAVWKRDGGQCAFVGTEGRCNERGFLEFHHVQPHAVGGPPVVDNIELRCRAHNVYEAEQFFGRRWPLLAREAERPLYRAQLGPDRVGPH